MSLTDRELLELAAKAAGLEFESHTRSGNGCYLVGVDHPWNPLQDLSQAKSLRHKLCLSTGYDDRFFGPCAYATYPTGPGSCNSIMQSVEEVGGKRAALRRAIVRAAAEIGKAMQEKH